MQRYLLNLYFKLGTKVLVSLLKRNQEVSHILLTGSVANSTPSFRSDLDIIILLKDGTDSDRFLKKYKKTLYTISPIFPQVLPIKERVSNVYSKRCIDKKASMIKGYLLNQKYQILFGSELSINDCALSKELYIADKIKLLIKAKNLNKLNEKLGYISSFIKVNNPYEVSNQDRDELKFKQIVKLDTNQHLLFPISTNTESACFFYKSPIELIKGANTFYHLHPQINSIHFSQDWCVFIDSEIIVINTEYLNLSSMNKKSENYPKAKVFDDLLIKFYLKDFFTYKQSKKNDALSSVKLNRLANYFNQHISALDSTMYKDFSLPEIIKIISGNDLPKENAHKISLCICTKNREASLLELFDSIKKQSLVPQEIILINNGKSWSEEYKQNIYSDLDSVEIRIFESSLTTISALRNFAISKANSEIISFVDDDCYLPQNWIETVFSHFNSDKDLTLLGGTVIHERQGELSHVETFHRSYLEERLLC